MADNTVTFLSLAAELRLQILHLAFARNPIGSQLFPIEEFEAYVGDVKEEIRGLTSLSKVALEIGNPALSAEVKEVALPALETIEDDLEVLQLRELCKCCCGRCALFTEVSDAESCFLQDLAGLENQAAPVYIDFACIIRFLKRCQSKFRVERKKQYDVFVSTGGEDDLLVKRKGKYNAVRVVLQRTDVSKKYCGAYTHSVSQWYQSMTQYDDQTKQSQTKKDRPHFPWWSSVVVSSTLVRLCA